MSEYDQFNPNKQDQEPPEILDYDSFVRGKPIMTTNLSDSRFNSNQTKSSNNSNNTYANQSDIARNNNNNNTTSRSDTIDDDEVLESNENNDQQPPTVGYSNL